MVLLKVSVLFVVFTTIAAYQSLPSDYHSNFNYNEDYDRPSYYKLNWGVKDDYYNDYGQQEYREKGNTKGKYWVLLPDGRKQIVNYMVDDYSGYVADVKYEAPSSAYAKPYNHKKVSHKPLPYKKSYHEYIPPY